MPPSDDPIILEPDRKIKAAGSDDPIILEPDRRVRPMGSDDPIILDPPDTVPAGSDDPIILEPDKRDDGPPITVQPVIVKWWKKWSTHLAGINLTAIIAAIVLIPERILDAIPSYVYGFIGIAFLAVILIPGATSIKQVKKVD